MGLLVCLTGMIPLSLPIEMRLCAKMDEFPLSLYAKPFLVVQGRSVLSGIVMIVEVLRIDVTMSILMATMLQMVLVKSWMSDSIHFPSVVGVVIVESE